MKNKYIGKPKYVVGIGASAGGLEALRSFFDNMPFDSGLAFVVVQHLSPDYKSLMDEILSKHTNMNVVRVENGMNVNPNCVYLIPPKKNMIIENDQLHLIDQPPRHGFNLPIDIFFRSLAKNNAEQAIGIILSGTGSDGTLSIRVIKEEGGMVMVQDIESSRFDGMPRSAMSTGLADFILPPEKMPEQLLKFINHPALAVKQSEHIVDHDYMGKIMNLIKSKTKVDFTLYKPNTVIRRIERRMGIVQADNIADYVRYLEEYPKEIRLLYKDLLIGVTRFFRDIEVFNVLKDIYIPKIIQNTEKRQDNIIRVWVVGCSTGEEVYSIAMLFHDYMQKHNKKFQLKLFGTDIDHDALKFAGSGIYPESVIADVDSKYINKFFEKTEKGYRLNRQLRSSVLFAYQNIINDPPFTKIDLISCRNLLIYLQPTLQQKVFSIFDYALLPDAYLLLGSSESIGEMENSFPPVDAKRRIYKHIGKGMLPIKATMGINIQYPSNIYNAMENTPKPVECFDIHKKYYEALIQKLTPVLLIINQERHLVHSFGNTKNYLSIPHGEASLDVLKLLPKELSLAASSGFHKVYKEEKEIVYKDIRIKNNDVVRVVTMKINIFKDPKTQNNLLMLILEEHFTEQLTKEEQAKDHSDSIVEHRIYDLEQELLFTRENLQATIEELQTSNEELQATNEELFASNEELQSTNEELQSVNEELNTVNTEYQEKVAELSELNNDVNNLIKSTSIGIIFLDEDFYIRRFSVNSIDDIDLRPQDIGRPLNTFSIPMMDNMSKIFKLVLSNGEAFQKNIVSRSGKCYLLSVLPYKDEQNDIRGLVLTFTDISVIKNFEDMLIKSESIRRSIMDNTSVFIYIRNLDGEVIEINEAMIKFLNLPRNKIIGKKIFDILPEETAIKEIVAQQKIIDNKKSITTNDKIKLLDKEVSFITVRHPIFNSKNEDFDSIGIFMILIDNIISLNDQ